VHDTFLDAFATVAGKLRVGAPLAEGVHVGPMVTAAQQRRVLDYISAFVLFGAVFAGDATRAVRVADALQAGVVLINNYDRNTAGSPFGGVEHSGFGREHAETLSEYGYSKTIRIPTATPPASRWSAVADVLSN